MWQWHGGSNGDCKIMNIINMHALCGSDVAAAMVTAKSN